MQKANQNMANLSILSNEKNRRIVWIDMLKGILLFLICIGHFGELPLFIEYIIKPTAMYYVPLFFVISGYLFSIKRKDFFLRKLQTLLLPYICFSILFIIIDWNTWLHQFDCLSNNLIQAFWYGKGVLKAAPLWFLITLFFSSCVTFLILKYIKSVFVQIICMLLLSSVSIVLSIYEFSYPLLFHIVPSATFFLMTGYFVNKLMKRGNNIFLSIICLLIGSVGFFIDLGDMHFNIINCYPLFFICPISMGYGIFSLVRNYEYRLNNLFVSICEWIANNGITILAFHCWLVFLFDNLVKIIPFLDNYKYVLFIAKLVFVSFILYIIIVPFVNKYFYWIVGKKKIEWKESYIQLK